MSDSPAPSLRGLDPWLLGATAALVAVGVANLHTLGDLQPARYGGLAVRQCVWLAIGAAAGLASFVAARRDRHRALGWVHVVAFGASVELPRSVRSHERSTPACPMRSPRR